MEFIRDENFIESQDPQATKTRSELRKAFIESEEHPFSTVLKDPEVENNLLQSGCVVEPAESIEAGQSPYEGNTVLDKQADQAKDRPIQAENDQRLLIEDLRRQLDETRQQLAEVQDTVNQRGNSAATELRSDRVRLIDSINVEFEIPTDFALVLTQLISDTKNLKEAVAELTNQHVMSSTRVHGRRNVGFADTFTVHGDTLESSSPNDSQQPMNAGRQQTKLVTRTRKQRSRMQRLVK